MIYHGSSLVTSIPFYYILAIYGLLYFSQFYHLRKGITHARNDNETHYSALVSGLLLGFLLRRRFIAKK